MIGNPLLVEPKPFFLQQGRIAVVWSMKSACSHVALWAFACEQLLPAATYYRAWPHEFREKVYYNSNGYETARRNFARRSLLERTVIRFTRCPKKRLVSVFRHVCRHDFLWPEIYKSIGVDVRRDGLALVEFDQFLKGRKLVLPAPINPHVCAQFHPIQSIGVDRTVTVNMDTHDLNTALCDLEAEFDLNVDRRRLKCSVDDIAKSHYASEFSGQLPEESIERIKFCVKDTSSFLSKELLSAPLLTEMVNAHYAIDLKTCASNDSAGKLFGTK